jgi:hypothetical protein
MNMLMNQMGHKNGSLIMSVIVAGRFAPVSNVFRISSIGYEARSVSQPVDSPAKICP